MSAAERWREQLEAWAIPAELLEAVDESPYGWPAELWKRRRATAEEREDEATPTLGVLRRMAPAGGTVLDVGAGTGRMCLPLAEEGYRVTAVERDPGMAGGFREEMEATGVRAELVEGGWPEVAELVAVHDAVLCAHVLYDVQDAGPFLEALARRAGRGVVIEVTARHPWAHLAPYYRALHGLDRPDGPTVDDLAAVVEEVVGVRPLVERWSRAGDLWFTDREELLEFLGRRLVLPRARRAQLAALVEPEIVDREGRLFLGNGERQLVTLWWGAKGRTV